MAASTTLPTSRHLTHTSQLPHSPDAIFSVLAGVQSYQHFLPLTTGSTVLTRDSRDQPLKFRLKVGYPQLGLYEDWTCRMLRLDTKAGVVEYAREDHAEKESVLQSWNVQWTVQVSKLANPIVKLDITLQFRSSWYDQVFVLLENQVARKVMGAFERRVAQVEKGQVKAAAEAVEKDREDRAKAARADQLREKLSQASRKGAISNKPLSQDAGSQPPVPKKAPRKLEIRPAKHTTHQ